MSEIRIGILGSPGTGKSELASLISEGWTDDLGKKPLVIDTTDPDTSGNLVEGHPTVDGLILGEKGTWRTSLVLYARLLASRHLAPLADHPTIEVGTCFDRMAHCGQRLVDLTARILDPMFTDTEREELLHLQQALPCVAIALVETWNYDYSFYLPVGDDATDYEKELDSALQELMESYLAAGTPLNILRLDGGSSSERADTVLKVLRDFEPARKDRIREIEEAEAALRNGEDHGLDGPIDTTAEDSD